MTNFDFDSEIDQSRQRQSQRDEYERTQRESEQVHLEEQYKQRFFMTFGERIKSAPLSFERRGQGETPLIKFAHRHNTFTIRGGTPDWLLTGNGQERSIRPEPSSPEINYDQLMVALGEIQGDW